MSKITVCYSTHRPETLGFAGRVMGDHDVIILEEPPHAEFSEVMAGTVALDQHLLELDVGYPLFTLGQYRLLQQLYKAGRKIEQIEPYLEHLLAIQYYLAENHSPEDIEPATVGHAVYCAEREATGALIDYYREVRGSDFEKILTAMNSFAKADAARFILRDSLRAKDILATLVYGKSTYVEAGSIHLLLYKLLAENLSADWSLHVHSVDREVMKILGHEGGPFSPGDELTLDYIHGRTVAKNRWALLCARALIYSKVVSKAEMSGSDGEFPHTRNEIESIAAVKHLSLDRCRTLFGQIRSLSSEEAADVVKGYGYAIHTHI